MIQMYIYVHGKTISGEGFREEDTEIFNTREAALRCLTQSVERHVKRLKQKGISAVTLDFNDTTEFPMNEDIEFDLKDGPITYWWWVERKEPIDHLFPLYVARDYDFSTEFEV